jgi:hypothetical protein
MPDNVKQTIILWFFLHLVKTLPIQYVSFFIYYHLSAYTKQPYFLAGVYKIYSAR